MSLMSRRRFVATLGQGAALAALGACSTTTSVQPTAWAPSDNALPSPLAINAVLDQALVGTPDYAAIYAPVFTEPYPIPAIDYTRFDPKFLRQRVRYYTDMPPGSIVVDPSAHLLYFIEPDGWAVRYGVGTGKAGFTWSGDAYIKFKREWPDWYPAPEYIARHPELPAKLQELQSGRGIAGGPRNPIGSRGLYLWQDNVDTLYRIHGTVEPYVIGTSVSSGCIRMMNQDAMDLFKRVEVDAKVRVLGPGDGEQAVATAL
ncbi:putative L,D-transpeptidase ErfK/SrfK precursor [Hartmannibacter diazotrophicus]|uniref:Putative L,D-transpeptidase ErfK/SrfK n=1 Tax=Hartmannibacter diazotrophicus TaxID=1482074 RepID=A0A2C9D824_9HYPH|nr:L,D-transpeptidase [Hartmannibacter diazotrophicus]SON56403.1 putative L,D-transpeptidase ErfK/SrfK precursor [Hartmannibacter diazotrophicus]